MDTPLSLSAIMDLTDIELLLKSRLDFEKMQALAFTLGQDKAKCEFVIELCVNPDPQIAFRASWVVACFAYLKPDLFVNYLQAVLNSYPKLKNPSVQRSFSKIIMLFSKKEMMHKYQLMPNVFDNSLDASFDWLLDSQTAVAVQANVAEIIFQLSPYHDWVLEELTIILQNKLVHGSQALKSRAKKILNASANINKL